MKNFQQLPFLKVLFPFVLGIFSAIYIKVPWQVSLGIIFGTITVHFLTIKYVNRKLKTMPHVILGSLLSLAFVALGYFAVEANRDINSPLHFQNHKAKYYKIRVVDYPLLKFGQYRFNGKVNEIINEQGKRRPSKGNLLCYWSANIQNLPEAGQDYWVALTLKPIAAPKNPGEFNYKQYLSYHNIYYKCYIQDALQIVKIADQSNSLKVVAAKMRYWSKGILAQYLPERRIYNLAIALILGSKNEMDEQVTEDFSHTGTLHVLAVSGLHVGIVFLLLTFITKPLVKVKHGAIIQGVVCLSGIWFFALLTGFSPSVQRAAIMFSLLAVAQISKVKGAGINTLLGSAFVMLVYNPFLIVNVGFQLSYCAVLGIMLIHEPVYNLFSFSNISNKYLWKIVNWCWSVCSISFAAQLGTFPISLFYFGQFPTYFLFSNLVVIPCIFLMVYACLAVLLFSFVPFLSVVFAFIFKCLSMIILIAVKYVAGLPFSYANGLYFGFIDVLTVYAVIAFFIVFLHTRKRRYINTCLLILVFLLASINWRYVGNAKRKVLTLHSIRNHDVITYLQGNTAYIVADSSFLNNISAQKFHLSPYFRVNYIKHIKFKLIQHKLAGMALNNDTLKVLIHQSKYPDVNRFMKDNSFTLILPKNAFNQKKIKANLYQNVIWKYQSPYALPMEDGFHNLDSFAFTQMQN